VHFVGLILYSS